MRSSTPLVSESAEDEKERLHTVAVELAEAFVSGQLMPGTYSETLTLLDKLGWPSQGYSRVKSRHGKVAPVKPLPASLSEAEVTELLLVGEGLLARKNANSY